LTIVLHGAQLLPQENPREQDRECGIRRREGSDDRDGARDDGLEVQDPAGAVDNVSEDAEFDKRSAVGRQQRRMVMGEKPGQVDHRLGEHEVQAETGRRHFADVLFNQALPDAI